MSPARHRRLLLVTAALPCLLGCQNVGGFQARAEAFSRSLGVDDPGSGPGAVRIDADVKEMRLWLGGLRYARVYGYKNLHPHDRYATLIAYDLALLARADLEAGSYQQAEARCDEAVKACDELVSGHLPQPDEIQDAGGRGELYGRLDAHVRGEMLRLFVFSVLQDLYREEGRHDLDLVVRMEMLFARSFLRSGLAVADSAVVHDLEAFAIAFDQDIFRRKIIRGFIYAGGGLIFLGAMLFKAFKVEVQVPQIGKVDATRLAKWSRMVNEEGSLYHYNAVRNCQNRYLGEILVPLGNLLDELEALLKTVSSPELAKLGEAFRDLQTEVGRGREVTPELVEKARLLREKLEALRKELAR